MEIRERIRQADDLQKEKCVVSEWDNVEIEIRGMSGKQRSDLIAVAIDEDGNVRMDRVYPDLLLATVFDFKGEKVFKPEDREWLTDKAGKVLERLALIACKLSGISGEAEKEIAKNSGADIPKEDSTSD